MISKVIKSIVGIALIALGIWTIVIWRGDVMALIRGGYGPFLILCGLISFALIAD